MQLLIGIREQHHFYIKTIQKFIKSSLMIGITFETKNAEKKKQFSNHTKSKDLIILALESEMFPEKAATFYVTFEMKVIPT